MSSSWYMVTPTTATVKFYGFERVAARAAKDIGNRLHSAQTVSTRAALSELQRYQLSDGEPVPVRPASASSPRVCPRARAPDARKAKRLDRVAYEYLLRRLQTPTLSFEIATGQPEETQQPAAPGRAGGCGATGVADALPSKKRSSSAQLLKRVTRPTTATLHKRVGVCAFCCELDLSSELYDCWTSGYDVVTAKELPAIVERVRSPTFSSGPRSTPCRKCRGSEAAAEAAAETAADRRPASSTSFSEPLISGLRRSPTVKDIVDRLYKRRAASPDDTASPPAGLQTDKAAAAPFA